MIRIADSNSPTGYKDLGENTIQARVIHGYNLKPEALLKMPLVKQIALYRQLQEKQRKEAVSKAAKERKDYLRKGEIWKSKTFKSFIELRENANALEKDINLINIEVKRTKQELDQSRADAKEGLERYYDGEVTKNELEVIKGREAALKERQGQHLETLEAKLNELGDMKSKLSPLEEELKAMFYRSANEKANKMFMLIGQANAINDELKYLYEQTQGILKVVPAHNHVDFDQHMRREYFEQAAKFYL